MIELDWETDRVDGVTLASAIVRNTATTPQIVRIECQLEGTVWAPDSEDRASGWTGSVWENRVEPDQRRGIGVASPEPPMEPPFDVIDSSRAPSDRSASPSDVLASLPEWEPTPPVLHSER